MHREVKEKRRDAAEDVSLDGGSIACSLLQGYASGSWFAEG
jgi:hypothetical protein